MVSEVWSFSEKIYRTLFKNINDLRKNQTLCDVVLKVEEQEFYAHRIILAACSDYFCAMFTNEMKERDLQVIELKGLSAHTMELILNCIYTDEVLFTTENVQEILPAASLLQLTDIQTAGADFLQSHLDPTNSLGIKQFAETHGSVALRKAAQEYIYEHFPQVVQHEEFLNLKFSEIEDLMKLDEIEVPNEEVVYNAAVNWINHDADNRAHHLPKLIIHVRLPLLSPKFITDVCDKEPLIRKSFECRDLLDEAKKFYLRPDCRAEMDGARFKIRSGKEEHLVILGGFGAQQRPLDTVEKYSPKTDTWTQLPPLTKKRRYAAAAAIGKRLYIIGGYDTKSRLKSVERLDLSVEKPVWETVASLSFRRALPAVCTYNSKIYVCGGFDGTLRHSTMECYNEDTDTWSLLDCTSVCREGACLVSLGDSLYCIGGYDGLNLLRSVEKYETNSGQWSLIAPMLTPRSGAGCAALNYRIFVCGGYDGHSHLSTVETYSTITGQWTNLCNLTISRCYCSASTLNGKIIVCAGYDGNSLLNTLEEYDEVNDCWQVKTKMPTARCDSGFAVLRYRN